MQHNRVAHHAIRGGALGDRALPNGAARLIRRRVAGERLTVQRDRVHVVRLLDRREVSARLRDSGVCEATAALVFLLVFLLVASFSLAVFLLVFPVSLLVLRQMAWTIVLFRTSTVVCSKIVHGRWAGSRKANGKLCAVHENKGEV